MRGRKPTPDALKVLAGNPGKRDLNLGAKPQPAVDVPDRPKCLTGAARDEWDRITPLLAEVGCVAAMDAQVLAVYCQWVSVFREALDEVSREGITIAAKTSIKKHPAVVVLKDASEVIRQYSGLFGLSPSDRARIVFQPDEYEDLFTEFMDDKNRLQVVGGQDNTEKK